MSMDNRVLFVDDDTNILAGFKRQFGKLYALTTAASADEALRLLDDGENFAVVVSDMRMPGKDGIALLSEFERRVPDTIRLLLTGLTDQEIAVRAINEGKIYSFLNKPIAPEALRMSIENALEHWRLKKAEREFLEQALGSIIKVMTGILTNSDPAAAARAASLRERVNKLLAMIDPPNQWAIRLAAIVSQTGWLLLPVEIRGKLTRQEPLTPAEKEVLAKMPEHARDLLRNIPRLDQVADIVYYQDKGLDGSGLPDGPAEAGRIPFGARILKVLNDFAAEEKNGKPVADILAVLRKNAARYDPMVLEAVDTTNDIGLFDDNAAE